MWQGKGVKWVEAQTCIAVHVHCHDNFCCELALLAEPEVFKIYQRLLVALWAEACGTLTCHYE